MPKSLSEKVKENKRTHPEIKDIVSLMIIARAGTGKTTTGVGGLNYLLGKKPDYDPSPQQGAIFDKMKELFGKVKAQDMVMLAFNKAIAEELQERVPPKSSAMTMHSLGYKAVMDQFGKLKSPSNWRTLECVAEVIGEDLNDLRKGKKAPLVYGTRDTVDLCKMNLIDGTDPEELMKLMSYYGIESGGYYEEIVKITPQVLDRCMDVEKDKRVDFADMIWLPVVMDLPLRNTYQLAIIDEAQDLNRCQQELARKVAPNLVFVGDDRQAIYGFAGADCDSLPRLQSELGCETLPLTVTYRCGHAIVAEANQLVSDFEAHESNPPGEVNHLDIKKYMEETKDGDMILCRVNAPLVSQCFKFLKAGRKANIRGKDIGKGLIGLIKKMKADDIGELSMKLSEWYYTETMKEQNKRYPSETRLISLQDKYDCLSYFIQDQKSVQDVIDKIETIFIDDDSSGVLLSTIHKAKGLEADGVFLLEPTGATVPHPMASTKWQRDQEWNLRYVAITRAINRLYYVTGDVEPPETN